MLTIENYYSYYQQLQATVLFNALKRTDYIATPGSEVGGRRIRGGMVLRMVTVNMH